MQESGFAGADEVIEDVAALQLERGDDGHHALRETAAGLAPGSEASLAPQDRRAKASFAEVIRGLDALDVNKCPHRGLHVEDFATHPRDFWCMASDAALEEQLDAHANVLGGFLEPSAVHGPVADEVPLFEKLLGQAKQSSSDVGGRSLRLGNEVEIAQQMSPAKLPVFQAPALVGGPSVRHQDACEGSQ